MSGTKRNALTATLLIASLGLALFSWAIASPLGSSPDDNFHMNSIWCAWGRDATGCRSLGPDEDPRQELVEVPSLTNAMPWCYAFRPEQSAACQENPESWPADIDTRSPANVSLYPHTYYNAMRVFVGPDVERSVLVMRVVNAALFVAVIGLALSLLPRPERWRGALFLLAGLTPLGVFIVASLNPSAWLIAGAATVFVSGIAICRARTNRRAIIAASAASGGALLAAAARSDAPIFAGFALLVAAVAAVPLNRAEIRRALSALALPAAVILLTYFVPNRSLSSDASGSLWSGSWLVLQIPELYLGPGSAQLSFSDTNLPGASWGAVALALGMIVAVGWGRLASRRTVALAVCAFGLVILPLSRIVAQDGVNAVGFVQPRYMLPLVAVTGVLLAVNLRGDIVGLPRDTALIIAMLLGVANAAAQFTLIRRFTTGVDVNGWNLDRNAEWWWDWAPPATVVWLLGFASFVVAAIVLAYLASGPRRQPRAHSALDQGVSEH